MKVVITGGSGFLGQRLAKKILDIGTLPDGGGEERSLSKLVLCDVVEPAAAGQGNVAADAKLDDRVEVSVGDLDSKEVLDRILTPDVGVIFHMAAVVSGAAEEDFDLGMRVNVDASRRLLDAARDLGTRPRFVFTSSVAAYGGDDMPAVVLDTTPLTPQSSYGCQKAIVELLVDDYTRRGFVDGRSVRLPTIAVRPGRPNKAASSFASSVVREPFQGSTYSCPVPPETQIWMLSPNRAIGSLVHAACLPTDAWGSHRAVSLPGLTVSVREMVEAMEEIGGKEVIDRIVWDSIDEGVMRIVKTWPFRFDTSRATAMGFRGDEGIIEVIRDFVNENLSQAPT